MSIFGGDAVARRAPVIDTTGTTTTKAKKHVTPKWVDRVLLTILVMIPVLYALGFSVNKGPSMGNLGLVYKTSWGKQPTRVGQIVRFAQPDQPTWRKYILPSIKRVAEIRKDGYYVEGDNTERSQDSSDWCKDVPTSHVAGVVVWCWSPARAWRSRMTEGKLRNWVEFHYNPNRTKWNLKVPNTWALLLDDHTMTIQYRYGVVFGPRHFDENTVGCQDFWNPDGSVTYTCRNKYNFPSLRRWSPSDGEVVLRDYRPNIIELQMLDGSRLKSLCSQPDQDPRHAFDNTGWGPVMASSKGDHYNYIEVAYPSPRKVSGVSATWTGGESLSVSCSSDGLLWKDVYLFNPPPPNGSIRSADFERPISSRFWRFELINDKSSIAGGMKLSLLQLR